MIRAALSSLTAGLCFAAAAAGLQVPATDLLGQPVLNPAAEHLGKVEDVIFDARDGSIRNVTIEFGGWLGLGEGEAAFSAAQLVPRDGVVVLDVPDGSLRRTPALGTVQWPAMRASALLGLEVVDRRHRDTGEIVDLVVDLDESRIRAAVIDLRDDWAPGERRVRVPIERFSLPRDLGDRATLNVAREKIAALQE